LENYIEILWRRIRQQHKPSEINDFRGEFFAVLVNSQPQYSKYTKKNKKVVVISTFKAVLFLGIRYALIQS